MLAPFEATSRTPDIVTLFHEQRQPAAIRAPQ
jgi:hypothetical protein